MTLGRNDPCYCGSGKKYKKCHWKQDQNDAAERAAKERARRERLQAMGQPTDAETRQLYQKLTGRPVPAGPLPGETHEMLAEMWQQQRLVTTSRERLAAEGEKWETYFDEHPSEFDRIAAELANDPVFDQYQLTDENSTRVRRELGPLPAGDEALDNYVAEALDMSLDEEDRTSFNEAILSLLPDLVDEGKMREAYVVAESAERVLDPDAPLTPFLRDVVTRSLQDT